jgi:signal transduction histidine kinase/putative methionine-R-sulfoxide reductase with GAF domain
MENVRTRPLSAIEGFTWRRWLAQAIALVYLLIGLGAYLLAPFLALRWIQTPFLGGFLEQTLIFNGAGPTGSAQAWSAYNQGLHLTKGDGQTVYSQLQAVNGQAVHNEADVSAILAQLQVGDTVNLQVLTSENQVLDQQVILSHFPLNDQFTYFYFPYLIGLVYLAAGVWVFAIRRTHASGRAFAQFCTSVALSIGLIFDLYTTHWLTPLWTIAIGLVGGTAIALVMLFPREDPLVRRKTEYAHVGSLAALLLAGYAFSRLYDFQHPFAYAFAWLLEYGFVALSILFIFTWSIVRRRALKFPNDREQVRWIALAAFISFSPVGVWLIATSLGLPWPFSQYLLFPLLIYPVVAGFTLQRYRIMQADLVVSSGLQYGLMSVIVVVAYSLLAAGLGVGTGGLLSGGNALLTGLIFFVLAIAVNPLRDWTQHLVDTVFFRGKRAFQGRLQTFSGDLTRVVDLPGILKILRRSVEDTLTPSRMHIFIYDSLSDLYVAAPDESGQPTSDLRFPMISGLAIRLSEQRNPLLLSDQDTMPVNLEPDRARLVLLGAQAFIPLPGRARLSGWLALGPRLSGEPYSSLQLGFVEALCDQAALAIERAQVVANMEKRVREMNVLTRVAQGINITLSLDDILELVYAQTTQIISAHSFRIMLYEIDLDIYQYAFYLTGEDRIAEREKRPVQVGQALEQEIIRQRRPILSDDYNSECQRRGIFIGRENLYAWMGVPLNAGAETIGALSLGSADPAVEYTPEQSKLLQAIADQVAGALVKARLLQETERRAHQLSSLNEVTRKLTSTLETDPLLQSILESAVEILNCEAGSLLMVDQAVDELIFKVTVGPVATSLVNRRMPAGQGVVGRAVRSGDVVIVNDVSRYPEWFSRNDQQTGFITRALLAIPLKVKDRVIGVVEVINKKDGTFFTRDDQDLLSAFASQAVVAIENARLYTLTDLALAARVEELSVMQRIDRELNTSLDTTTAMRITLDWAMRQSGASAGLVAILKEGDTAGVQVMASQGYASEMEPYEAEILPTAEYQLDEVIKGGTSIRRSISGRAKMSPLLQGGKSQAILPIRRETTTIGLLLLESLADEPITDEIMGFLSRLTDHASIAISNAQLYAAVQQANLAKSDFVSFVAHELKNPMTSVKGYTELISAGAVGPVTEIQANFLSTIRHNIERMNTLVSDLNDMSKIEVGRLRLDFKSITLKDIIESVVRSTRKQIEEKQQTLALNIPDDLAPVWADRTRVEQVMVNLISNAHKYTPAAGIIEVAAEHCANQWDANGAANVIHIWVKDNGIGISEEDQKKIFQKFFRSEDQKTREVPGTGLGLNITRSLVEMQGGQIWFESEFRKGTTFHFTIPVSET